MKGFKVVFRGVKSKNAANHYARGIRWRFGERTKTGRRSYTKGAAKITYDRKSGTYTVWQKIR